jgi:hypothetical protein
MNFPTLAAYRNRVSAVRCDSDSFAVYARCPRYPQVRR